MTNILTRLQENGMPISSKMDNPTNGEIHIWRMRVAVVWSIIIQLMMFLTYILFISADPFHPLSWIANCFSVFLSLSLWPKLVVLVLTIYSQGEVCKRDYVTGPVYHVTRFQKIRHIFSIRNILLMLLHVVIGVTVFCIYSSIHDSTSYFLVKPCVYKFQSKLMDSCLVENNLFLLLGGVWIGIFYFVNDYMFGSRNLIFPLIQQYKFYRVKAALKENMKHSIKHSVVPTVIFLILYYIYGGLIRSAIAEFLSLKMDKEPIDSIRGLLNIKLIFYLWLFSSIFVTGLHTMELLFNVHLTEHCVFPVSNELLPTGNHMRLIDSLKKADVPIIHHLGYLDLFILSTKCRQRREEIFTLSHPGGHPHDWNSIHKECITLIKTFTSDLSQALLQDNSNKKDALNKVSKVEVTGFHFHNHNIRKLASPMGVKMVGERTLEAQSAVEVAFNNIQNWVNAKLEQFYKKPYIAYFFGESPDTRINFLLCKSQPVIWAVQGLAFLCSASLTEDRYGIVQKDLPDIINTVVNLKQVLDKLFKQNLIVKKSFANDPLDVQMKYLLRSSVKRSLYLIAVTFGPYMKDIQLPVDVKLQLDNFSAFKEV
ncbi:nucleoporin NDC1 [Macrosteles quadrilineatus]|uniref:nucleoporin NDC1 n=1 Tax=Macrosteles quadrilineatus TaxID=74068 RepID=UPI0023E18A67|nr:nucleoporin NDC1 [Macrosteles quadrilineatus]